MQAENIKNETEEKRRKLSQQFDTEIEIEKSQTPSPESKAVDYDEPERKDEIPEKRDHTKDF